MVPFLMGALTGAGFGVVLYKVGATRYSRIMGMLTLRDTKIMKWTFATIAVASILYGLSATLGLATPLHLAPRTMPFLGWAHLLGGAMFGVGMGVSGLCPGTCVAKFGGRGGAAKYVTPAAVAGLFVGVLVYDAVKGTLLDVGVIASHARPLTLPGILGLPYGAVALIFGALMLLMAYGADRFLPEHRYEPAHPKRSLLDWIRGEWSWTASAVVAGLLIVLATAQGGYLGFSGALLALSGTIAHLVGVPLDAVPAINDDILWRAALLVGVLPGGFLAAILSLPSKASVESPLPKTLQPLEIAKAFGAATLMTVGALIGGGCTTGAYLAGWPTLSLGSFAMGATFFAVSMATSSARLFVAHSFDLKRAQCDGDRVYD